MNQIMAEIYKIKCPCGRVLAEKAENGMIIIKKGGKELTRMVHGIIICPKCGREHFI